MIFCEKLSHSYRNNVPVLRNIDLRIGSELVAIVGVSGAGKTTLLRCINYLIKPTQGEVYIKGVGLSTCSEAEILKIRRKIGMIFQNFNLLKRWSAMTNVLMGRLGYKMFYFGDDKSLARDCLKRVGLEDFENKRVDMLSGGQQQRVGIARALAQQPEIILADEPVSNLDTVRSHEIMGLLSKIQKEEQMPVVISLHDLDIAKSYSDRIIALASGGIVFDGPPQEMTNEIMEEVFV